MTKDGLVYVLSADPGGKKDTFFALLTRADKVNKTIGVISGISWKFVDGQIDYTTIEKDLSLIYAKYAIDFFVVEENNTGLHVVQTMKSQYHVPTYAVYTANNIKTQKTIRKGTTMDKSEHLGWINQQIYAKKLLKSKNPSPGVQRLMAQMASFVKEEVGGKIKYHAEGNQPDDAVMALMINTFFIRRKIFGEGGITGKRQVAFKKYNERDIALAVKSAIPDDCKMLGSTTKMSTATPTGKYRIH